MCFFKLLKISAIPFLAISSTLYLIPHSSGGLLQICLTKILVIKAFLFWNIINDKMKHAFILKNAFPFCISLLLYYKVNPLAFYAKLFYPFITTIIYLYTKLYTHVQKDSFYFFYIDCY